MPDLTITSPPPFMPDLHSPPKTPRVDPRTAFYKLLGMDENSLPPPSTPGAPMKPVVVSIPTEAFNPYYAQGPYFYPHHWVPQNPYYQTPFLYPSASSDVSSSSSSSPETPSVPLIAAAPAHRITKPCAGRYTFIRSPEDLDIGTVDILCSASPAESRVVYDVRFHVRNTLRSASGNRLGSRELSWPAASPAANRMLIVCPDLPWSIEIKAGSRNPQGVTVGEVMTGIAEALDKDLLYSEKFICKADKRKEVEESQKRNTEAGCGVAGRRKEDDETKRVDWLGSRTMFRGITRPHTEEHHALVKQRVHERDLGQVWILELGEPESSS
ncbi:hypothetical protein FRC02_004939 [Tulasnella sp. 418]|nr:hypothetical protein FRC02_004939 [Tulasnella sp. 418]